MLTRSIISVLVIVLIAAAARAEVYEWRDGDGSRHFTNSLQGVPAEYQNAATVFVAEWTHPASSTATAPAPAPAAPPSAAPTSVDVTAAWNEAYAAGLRAATEIGGAGAGGDMQINEPLAIANAPESQPSYGYPPYAFYPPSPWYYPLVTVGFDRGRSRGLTVRRSLKDQCQIDRDGPGAHRSLDQPGLGPALAPFLPRGLSYGVSHVTYR
ncbi:MAG: DUF4124 domain-containing protein [Mycobacteriales bacterium]